METLLSFVGFAFSAVSATATAYFWLVRANRERPNLKVQAAGPLRTALDMNYHRRNREQHLRTFLHADAALQAQSRAGIGHYYFMVKAMVVNASLLPITVSGARARVKTRDGAWLGLNTAYQAANAPVTVGPFAFDADDGHQAADPGQPLEPQAFVVPGEQGQAVRLLAWLYVPEGDRAFEWDRVSEAEQLKAVRGYVEGLLAQPVQLEVELPTLSGRSFACQLDLGASALPGPAALPGIPLPTLSPVEKTVKPPQRAAMLANIRKQLATTARPDGSFGDYFSDTSDLELAAYAVLAHRSMGWPLPHEEATRGWLLDRQHADGGFDHTQGRFEVGSPESRVENAHLALMALFALGAPPRRDPLPALVGAARQVLSARAAEGQPAPASLAHAVAHCHLLAGRPMPDELDRLLSPLASLPPVFNEHFWEVEEAVFHPMHYHRLLRRPIPQAHAEATYAYVLRTVGRRGKIDHDTWRFQQDSRRLNMAIFAGVCSARQLAPADPRTRRLLDEATEWLFDRGHDREEVVYGSDIHRQLYATLAALLLSGEIKPERPLACDAHLFGLGEHMATA